MRRSASLLRSCRRLAPFRGARLARPRQRPSRFCSAIPPALAALRRPPWGKDAPKRLLQPKPKHVHPGTARLPGPGLSPRIREAPSPHRPTPAMRARFRSEFFLAASSRLAAGSIPAGAPLDGAPPASAARTLFWRVRVSKKEPPSGGSTHRAALSATGEVWRAASDTPVAPDEARLPERAEEPRTAAAASPSREEASSIRGAFHR